MSTGKQTSLREQSAWLLAAKLIGFAFSLALPLLVVRSLTQEQVGHYREAFQIITNAIVILPLGFSMSAYYFLAREKERRGSAILNILVFNFVVGGLACLFLYIWPGSVGAIFRSAELTRLAPMIGVVIWIWIFSTFLDTVAIANSEARVATLFIILAQLTKAIFLGGALLAFGTVEAFLYAAIIQGALQTAVLMAYLRSRFAGFWRSFDPAFFWEQARYALPFGLAGILWMAQNDIHSYFAGHKLSAAEYAIYAYGCFEIPLLAMLSESVTSVLIPRMNALQQDGDRSEMIRLTVRAMQKLAFFYFPIYVFLMVTARTFVITLFTENFAASADVLIINITLLPFGILITDPIVRSYKELGRLFLATRIVILIGAVGTLWFLLDSLSMTGLITIAVVAIVLEKLVAESMVIRKLGLGLSDLPLLADVGKTAIASVIAGAATYVVYSSVHEPLFSYGYRVAEDLFGKGRLGLIDLVGGGLVLGVSALVFLPVYLLAANFLGLIEDDEKATVKKVVGRVARRRHAAAEVR